MSPGGDFSVTLDRDFTLAMGSREMARMRTAFLKEPSGIEVQLVTYDEISISKTAEE